MKLDGGNNIPRNRIVEKKKKERSGYLKGRLNLLDDSWRVVVSVEGEKISVDWWKNG